MLHRFALALALVLNLSAVGAHAQLVSVNVSGATEEARAFATAYKQADGAPPWSVVGSLVAFYRVIDPNGTITISVTARSNTPPRAAQGPTSTQRLRIATYWNDTLVDDQGHPDEELTVQYQLPFSSTGIGAHAVKVVLTNLPGRCGIGDGTPCGEIAFYLHFTLRPAPQLQFGGSVRPRLFIAPFPNYFQMSALAFSPMTEVSLVSIDGVAATKIPSGVVPLNQTPGPLNYDRYAVEPLLPGDLVHPSGDAQSMERFLGCGGGGCGVPGIRVGLPVLGTGLHRVRVAGSAYDGDSTFSFFGTESVVLFTGNASADVEEEFIFLKPQLTVSPSPIVAGGPMTVTGTGFGPAQVIPVRTSLGCCANTLTTLGEVLTDLTGGFTLQATAPLFASAWAPNAPPGTTAAGTVQVAAGGPTFVSTYSLQGYTQSASVTYAKAGNTSSTTTTTTIAGATTTTTLPGSGCTSDAACNDGNACTQDTCSAGACIHTPLSGASGATCAVPPEGLSPPSCRATTVPAKLDKNFDKATGFIARALDKPRKAVKRLVKRADKFLKKSKKIAEVAGFTGALPAECADDLVEVIDGVRSRVGFVLDNL